MGILFCIIVTYNGEKYIDKCLKSLESSSYPLNIIVIDNNSQDNTVDIIDGNYPNVELLSLETNVGFGMANNIGIQLAYNRGADYFFLLNQDVFVQVTSLFDLISISKNHPNYGILSPIHLNGKGDQFDYLFSIMALTPISLKLFTDLHLNQELKDVYNSNFVNAAAWLLTKSCIEQIGGFDPLFYHYGEDEDYANRVLFKKIPIGICPSVHINHDRVVGNKLSQYSISYQRKLRLLIRLKNPFHQYSKTLKSIITSLIWEIIRKLFSGQIKSVIIPFNILKYLLVNSKKIKYQRKRCISETYAFLKEEIVEEIPII